MGACLRAAEQLHGLHDAIPVLLCELIPRLCCSRKIAAGLRDVVAAEQESIRLYGHSVLKSHQGRAI